MPSIKNLNGIASVEVDKENCKLFIEDAEGGGIEIDLNIHELMHLLGKHTAETWGNKEIYGIPDEPPFEE